MQVSNPAKYKIFTTFITIKKIKNNPEIQMFKTSKIPNFLRIRTQNILKQNNKKIQI